MQHLWAPWRHAYVQQAPKDGSHIFSRIAQSTEDEENLVLARGKSCFALLNLYPYNTAHTLVVPYRVVADLDLLGDDELLELMTLLKQMKRAIAAAFQPQGFNVGLNLGAAAGAGIEEHLHLHLVPRWRTDANFMTTTAETRVHPSDLGSVHAKIKAQLG